MKPADFAPDSGRPTFPLAEADDYAAFIQKGSQLQVDSDVRISILKDNGDSTYR